MIEKKNAAAFMEILGKQIPTVHAILPYIVAIQMEIKTHGKTINCVSAILQKNAVKINHTLILGEQIKIAYVTAKLTAVNKINSKLILSALALNHKTTTNAVNKELYGQI